jgi:catalase-peroxidase
VRSGGRDIEDQGIGWRNRFRSGYAGDAITSGLELTWTTTPTKWSNDFFKHLFGYEWELTKSPPVRKQWKPKGGAGAGTVPDAHDKSKKIAPNMLTTRPLAPVRPGVREDLAALHGASGSVRRRVRRGLVQAHPPRHGSARALPRPGGPEGELIWQDPVPAVDHKLIDDKDVRELKGQLLKSGLSDLAAGVHRLGVGVHLPWLRQAGGANGARIRLAPQKDWEVNHPKELAKILKISRASRRSSTARRRAARRSRWPT